MIENAHRQSAAGADQRSARSLDPGGRYRAAADPEPGAHRGRRELGRRGGAAPVRGPIPGDPLRRRRGDRGRDRRVPGAGRVPRRAGLLRLPAQRQLPRLASSRRRPPRLQRLQGRDGAHLPGGRGAGVGHPPQPLLDATGLRHRLLAQGCGGHSGGHEPGPHRPHQEGYGRDLRRCEEGGAAAPRAAVRQCRRCRPRGAPGGDPSDPFRVAPDARQHGPRRRRSGNHLERGRRTREPDRMSARMAWRAIQDGLPKDAIISSDIGNNCAIGNAYPTFEEGRKYLAPGLFGPCGYGFPAIIGAKIGCPHVPGGRFRRRWRLRHLHERDGIHGARGVAGDHHGDLFATTSGARRSATRYSGTTTTSSAPS